MSEQVSPTPQDIRVAMVNGELPLFGSAAYTDAVYHLYKKKETDFKNNSGYGNLSIIDRFFAISEREPEVFSSYFRTLWEEESPFQIEALCSLISQNTEHAKGLKPLFDSYPQLLRVYAHPFNASVEAQQNNTLIRGRRISASTKEPIIRERIESNKQLYTRLLQRIEEATVTEDIPGLSYVIASEPFAVSQVILHTIGKMTDLPDGIRLRIVPIDPAQYDFIGYEVDLYSNGLLQSVGSFDGNRNLGYCFLANSLDEDALVRTLVDNPFQTPQLANALESIPSVESLMT